MPSLGNVCSNDDSQAWHARAAAALNTFPDLIVYRPSQSAGNLVEEESFTLNATVKNQGTAASGSTTLRYYHAQVLPLHRRHDHHL